MANIVTHRPASSFGTALRTFWESVKDARMRREAYRRTYAELAGLTDRELTDIGIARSEITRIAREHADMQ